MFKVAESESRILKINIARADENCLANPSNLIKELKNKEIDILKLTCKNPSKDLYIKLDSLATNYYVLGIVQEYKAIFSRSQGYKEYLHQNLSFVEYSSSKKETLEFLVRNIFKNNSTSYFQNPILSSLHNSDEQLTCLFNYIVTFNKGIDESKYTHIMYKGEEPIGFITSYKEGNGGGVLYAGVLDEYVGRGYYRDMVRFIQNYGKEIEQRWGLSYAEIHHTTIHKTFIKEGLVPNGYVLNIHINACLGKLKDV